MCMLYEKLVTISFNFWHSVYEYQSLDCACEYARLSMSVWVLCVCVCVCVKRATLSQKFVANTCKLICMWDYRGHTHTHRETVAPTHTCWHIVASSLAHVAGAHVHVNTPKRCPRPPSTFLPPTSLDGGRHCIRVGKGLVAEYMASNFRLF